MSRDAPTSPITVRTAKDIVDQIDALATATDRSRNYIVNQALRQYLDSYDWQVQCIEEGIAAARGGDVRPADDVFADIATKHGWKV